MPTGLPPSPPRRTIGALVAAFALALLTGCADLGPVRDFSRSAAAVAVYPQGAAAYVDSAVSSAPFVAEGGESLVGKAQRQAQVGDALALKAALAGYFETLARLAGDDAFDLAAAKSMWADARAIGSGTFDKTALDAYASLTRTLTGFADAPARERAVRALVEQGGPSAMRILAALRSVAGDWRAQVANDARQVDATLAVAVLPADVPPLLRILATDRRAQLTLDFAARLRQLRSTEEALDRVAAAHTELASHLDDLAGEVLRQRLRQATAGLRAGWTAVYDAR